jgi:putative spermidine/putrescine transport system ATP-binding protein
VGLEGRQLKVSGVGSAAVAVSHLVKRYGAATIIDDLSFDVAAGEFMTLLGPSGCGKTTVLRCIGGFVAPDGGSIRIGGEDMTGTPPHRRDLGMVFQNHALFPHLSVADNVGFGLRVRRVARSAIAERVARALDLVRLGGLGDRLPRQLSGGQQQRVALARALIYEPRVLLLDEPLSSLDAKLRVAMRAEIRSLQQRLGVTAIYVTHDQEEALSVSDRVMVMHQGRIEQVSSPWDIYNRPRTRFVASFVGTANILPVVRDDLAGTLRVAGAFTVPCPPCSTGGQAPGWVVARPETIGAGPIDASDAGCVAGTVRDVTLLGPSLRLTVVVGDAVEVLVDLPQDGQSPGFAAGDRIGLHFDPRRLVGIPG